MAPTSNRLSVALALSIFLTAACGPGQEGPSSGLPVCGPDEYDVYSAFLDDWHERGSVGDAIIMTARTGGKRVYQGSAMRDQFELELARGELPGADLGLVDHYIDAARIRIRLENRFTSSVPVHLMFSEVQAHFWAPDPDDGFWRIIPEFYEAFPDANGFTKVSPVGIDPSGTRALLCAGHSCGSLCGYGECAYLEKDASGTWVVVSLGMQWIS